MVRSTLYALAALLILAMPASAGTVTVGSVTASQYNYPMFAAQVYATGTSILGDVQLTVTNPDGTVSAIQPDTIERVNLDGYGLYVIYKIHKYYTPDVVQPGQLLTAIVQDVDGGNASKTVPCTAPSTKKKTAETANCQ